MPAQTTAAVAATEMPALLRQHLTGWAGGLPAADRASGGRQRPQRRARLGRPPAAADRHRRPGGPHRRRCAPGGRRAARRLSGPWRARSLTLLPGVLGKAGHTVGRVAFRWTVAPADLPDAGVWVDTASPRLPGWLRPFGGQALVVFDDNGQYLAGRHQAPRRARARDLGRHRAAGPRPGPRAAPGRPGRPAHPRPGPHPERPAHLRQRGFVSRRGRGGVPRPRLVRADAQPRTGERRNVAA